MKKIISGICILFSCLVVNAQKSTVRIIDFEIYPESVFDKDTTVDPTMEKLTVHFKCNDYSKFKNAYLLFGSSPDNADVATIPIDIKPDKDTHTLTVKGKDFPSKNKWESQITFLMPKQDYQKVNYVTFYIKDKSDETTTRLNKKVK